MKWTAAQVRRLRKLFPTHTDAEVARLMGRTEPSICRRAIKLGLRKTAKYKRAHDARFEKGMVPWNKGLHGVNGHSSTRFKRGDMPQTWKPVGTEVVRGDGILYRKVKDTRRATDWVPVHVLIYRKLHGRVPKGKFVIFADRNKTNFAPENLIAVTRAENMDRNTVHNYPKPIALAIQLKGALQRQINLRLGHENDRRFKGASVRDAGGTAGRKQADGHRPR